MTHVLLVEWNSFMFVLDIQSSLLSLKCKKKIINKANKNLYLLRCDTCSLEERTAIKDNDAKLESVQFNPGINLQC